MEKVINCTPHNIVIDIDCGDEKTILEPSGILPRVETSETTGEPVGIYPCVVQSKGDVIGLPPEKKGVFLLVSAMVFSASDRTDLLAPDTGKSAIRNEKGHIVAVTRLIRK